MPLGGMRLAQIFQLNASSLIWLSKHEILKQKKGQYRRKHDAR